MTDPDLPPGTASLPPPGTLLKPLVTSVFNEYLLLLQFGPAVLASVPVLALDLADPQMRIIWCSSLLEEMFGYQAGDLTGQPLDTLLCPEDRVEHHAYYLGYCRHPTVRTMNAGVWVNGIKKDASIIKVQVSLCPYPVGKMDCVIAHVADVTRAWQRLTPPPRPMEDGH